MNNQLIPVFAGEISGVSVQLVDARLLHKFLKVVTRFNDWIARRIEEYDFKDGEDFYSKLSKTKGRPNTEYHLSLDMAKELSMVEKNDKGKLARRYFIDMERIAKTAITQLEPPTITKAQQGILFNLVGGKSDHSGKGRSYYWSRFASHFKLASYKDLPIDKFDEAHQYLQGLEGEEMLYITVSELNRVVDSNIKRAIEAELLPKPEIHHHNSITINLAPLADHQMRRWLVTQALNEMTVLEALNSNQVVKTREQFIQELICDGYLVMKKEDILGRLQA